MAWKNYIAFGAGEISPEIFERGNLDKFRTGLATLRNCTVTKMAGVRGRAGTVLLNETNGNESAKYHVVPEKNLLFEFTLGHMRVYEYYNPVTESFLNVQDFTIDMSLNQIFSALYDLHTDHDENFVYLFVDGFPTLCIRYTDYGLVPIGAYTSGTKGSFGPNGGPVLFTVTGSGSPSGPAQQYTYTQVVGGVESFIGHIVTGSLPTGGSQKNVLSFSIKKASFLPGSQWPEQVKYYRRPTGNGSFGLVGVAGISGENATDVFYHFDDIGGAADFSDRPTEFQADYIADVLTYLDFTDLRPRYSTSLKARTGTVFQGRLVVSGTRNKSLTLASRVNSLNMTRDFPLQDDSALAFKSGSGGSAIIKRYFDARGLLVFTNIGVYETPEVLTPSTAYATKRSGFVIDDYIEPIMIGDYVFFYDHRIKGILAMVPFDNGGWKTSEVSIFSNHLFKDSRVVSWAVQNEDTQILWIVLDNGKLVSFSFQDEQQLRSFARHDTDGFVDNIMVITPPDEVSRVLIQVERNGVRYLERLSDERAELIDYVGADSAVIYKYDFNDGIHAMNLDFTNYPTSVSIYNSSENFANTAGNGAVGTVFRVFREDGFALDLEVISYTSPFEVEVIPVGNDDLLGFFGLLTVPPTEYPIGSVYKTWTTLTGLAHLEGKKVSVRLDGFTHASPLNTEDNLNEYTVTGGQIVLNDTRGAIISVGLPYAQDIVTLEVDTAEQTPTNDESMICNTMYLSYFNSHPFFTGATLPKDDTVTGMSKNGYQYEPDDGIVIKGPQLLTESREIHTEGDWKVKGSVALRNVDPQPTGLRAIKLDLERRRRP